ncbi:hypothetical protein IAU60_001911 [Kwoniella sp. DSM 27419]
MPQTRASDVAKKAEEVVHDGSQLLTGQVPHSEVAAGHPIHPATVHWPIASLYPATVLPNRATLSVLGFYAAGAGVVSAVPAIVTGIGEAYELIRSEYLRKGSWAAVIDSAWNMKDNEGRKIKMTIKHASMNDMVVALAGYNWMGLPRRAAPPDRHGPQRDRPARFAVLMVYEYAMGVQRQGSGKEVKEKSA